MNVIILVNGALQSQADLLMIFSDSRLLLVVSLCLLQESVTKLHSLDDSRESVTKLHPFGESWSSLSRDQGS